MTSFAIPLLVTIISGLYTSLWGAFKDSPYEGFKGRTFPRSIYFNVVIFAALLCLPALGEQITGLGLFQLFFVVMGIERFLAELYKGFFRTEDQSKYFVPSRITFFGRHVASDWLRRSMGSILVATVLATLFVSMPVKGLLSFAVVGYGTGLLVSLGGAYKDAPFEGFKAAKFQRSGVVLALASPLLYFITDAEAGAALGFLIFMNGGLDRFVIEYYKTYIQRNMSGKFRSDLEPQKDLAAGREKFHYLALVIIASLFALYVVEYRELHVLIPKADG